MMMRLIWFTTIRCIVRHNSFEVYSTASHSVHVQVGKAESPMQSCVPPLTALCQAAVLRSVDVGTVCGALSMVDLLHPVLDEVAPTLIGFLARNLVNVLMADSRGVETLPASLMAEVLGNPCLVRPQTKAGRQS